MGGTNFSSPMTCEACFHKALLSTESKVTCTRQIFHEALHPCPFCADTQMCAKSEILQTTLIDPLLCA